MTILRAKAKPKWENIAATLAEWVLYSPDVPKAICYSEKLSGGLSLQ
jgi:hypothetical protein